LVPVWTNVRGTCTPSERQKGCSWQLICYICCGVVALTWAAKHCCG
jgi:hypothetical protein